MLLGLFLLDLVLFISLGAVAGVLAGLLGLGGGVVIVPGLVFIFAMMKLPEHLIMHFAAGTSLCVMIFTAIASGFAHYRHRNIEMDIFLRMVPMIILGTILGAVIARLLHSDWLSIFFGLLLFSIGIKLILEDRGSSVKAPQVPQPKVVRIAGFVIGIPAGMLGVGGGTFTVPFLTYYGIPMKSASGTSASLTLPVSIVGTFSFILLGWSQPPVGWSSGFVYWPAVLCIAPVSMLFAPLGAKLADVLPAKLLKRVFAVLMLLLAIKMLWMAL